MQIEGVTHGTDFSLRYNPNNVKSTNLYLKSLSVITEEKIMFNQNLLNVLNMEDDTTIIAHCSSMFNSVAYLLTVKELKIIDKAEQE